MSTYRWLACSATSYAGKLLSCKDLAAERSPVCLMRTQYSAMLQTNQQQAVMSAASANIVWEPAACMTSPPYNPPKPCPTPKYKPCGRS